MTTSLVNKEYLRILTERIQDLYVSDSIPWVVGYSGGKDSSSVLQLVWNALKELPEEHRNHKPVHVISTDTLVEQPVVAAWVNRSLGKMNDEAEAQGLPIQAHRLTPKTENSFWVQLIGKGYPAPRNGFRWCTSRLKIDPSNRFITDLTKKNGEAILVLGTRKAESVSRAANMNHYEKMRVRQWLSPNGSLPNSWVFSPIEEWTSDDVWTYLMQVKNPWGANNKELMAMYREATADNECPLVVDNTTPTCGNSRFGCWVCTLVSEDKSMKAMIQNDAEKEWMTPLLEFRKMIASKEQYDENDPKKGRIYDHHHRDYRRMNGSIKLYSTEDENPETIPGPYRKERREELLRGLLQAQKEIEETAPEDMENIELISLEELQAIRKIWVQKKSEFDDSLPRIYEEELGRPYPDQTKLNVHFGLEEWNLLQEVVKQEDPEDHVYMDMMASLLNAEQNSSRLNNVRKGVVQQLEGHIRRCYYENREDAATFKLAQLKMRRGDQEAMSLEDDELDILEEDGETVQ